MASIADVDIQAELATQIAAVAATGGSVEIVGSGSKRFYGEPLSALPIEVSAHSGIIDYDPAELVITLRAGCCLREVEALLAEKGTTLERLQRMLGIAAEITCEQVEMQAVVLDFWAASRGTKSEERYNQSCVETFRTYRQLAADVIREGQTAGELNPAVDADATAVMMVAAIDGLGVQIFFDRELDPVRLVENFSEVLLAGLEVKR